VVGGASLCQVAISAYVERPYFQGRPDQPLRTTILRTLVNKPWGQCLTVRFIVNSSLSDMVG
jgi:hypothetical protein